MKGPLAAKALQRGGRSVTLVDDTYNANPDSVRAAIDVLAELPGPRWLVLGDMGEVGDQGPAFHAEVGALCAQRGVEHAVHAGRAVRARHAWRRRAAFRQSEALFAARRARRAVAGRVHRLVKGSLHSWKMERVVGRTALDRHKKEAPMLLSLAQWLQGLAGVRLLPRLPVPHLPRGDGGDDGAADRPGLRALGDPPADRAEDRPADPRLRRADPPGQERHADHGRRADPDRHRRLHAAVVRLEQPLRLDRDDRDLGFGAIGWADDWRKVVRRTPRACARREVTSGSR